jgi:hypothetical protein
VADTYDVALEAGGFGFRVRVYPADTPSGSALVWLHGGALEQTCRRVERVAMWRSQEI